MAVDADPRIALDDHRVCDLKTALKLGHQYREVCARREKAVWLD